MEDSIGREIVATIEGAPVRGVVTGFRATSNFPYTVDLDNGSKWYMNPDEFQFTPDPSAIPPEADEDWNSTGECLAHGERMDDYGHPIHNFRRIAGIWSAILDTPVTPEDVALCMIGVKVSREKANHKPDNLDDIDGYVACLRMVVDGPTGEAANV